MQALGSRAGLQGNGEGATSGQVEEGGLGHSGPTGASESHNSPPGDRGFPQSLPSRNWLQGDRETPGQGSPALTATAPGPTFSTQWLRGFPGRAGYVCAKTYKVTPRVGGGESRLEGAFEGRGGVSGPFPAGPSIPQPCVPGKDWLLGGGSQQTGLSRPASLQTLEEQAGGGAWVLGGEYGL